MNFSVELLPDLAAGAVLLYGAIRGFVRGLSGMLGDTLLLAGSLAAALLFYDSLGAFLQEHTRLTGIRAANGLAFVALLAAGWIGLALLRAVGRRLFDFKFRGLLEKLGGVVMGLLMGLMLVLAVLMLITVLGPNQTVEESRVGRMFGPAVDRFYSDVVAAHPELDLRKTFVTEPEPEAEPGAVPAGELKDFLPTD
jgi:uncharacterized membrane protein required for colicin V production